MRHRDRIALAACAASMSTFLAAAAPAGAATPAGRGGPAAAATAAPAAATSVIKPTITCLEAHHVPGLVLRSALGLTTRAAPKVGSGTLRSAGAACQHTVARTIESDLVRLESCFGKHHVKMANTTSPLAKLLLLEPESATTKSTVTSCETSLGFAGRSLA